MGQEESLLSNYNAHSRFWRVGDELIVDLRDPHPVLCQRESEETWVAYGSQDCKARAARDGYQGRDWYFGPLMQADDNDETSAHVKLVKWQACGIYHGNSRWYKGPRYADVPLQQVQEDVYLLSLDAGLAHGLDLSFVTHIFLLEPIADAALLEQVTSRAHRLGATGSVTVETINVFFKVSDDLKQVLDDEQQKSSSSSSIIHQERDKTLSKVICQYCYREFPSHAHAEAHEAKNCQRNPTSNVVDKFQLSSIYREIKPPAARLLLLATEEEA